MSKELYEAVQSGDFEKIKTEFYAPGVDINWESSYETSILRAAVLECSLDVIELLLTHPDIDVNIVGKHDEGALELASKLNKFESFKLMLNHPSFCLNYKDRKGKSILDRIFIANRRNDSVLFFLQNAKLSKQQLIDIRFYAVSNGNFTVAEAIAVEKPSLLKRIFG